jgi:hypothetical protein
MAASVARPLFPSLSRSEGEGRGGVLLLLFLVLRQEQQNQEHPCQPFPSLRERKGKASGKFDDHTTR